MPDLFHDLPVFAAVGDVFKCVYTPDGISKWWSISAKGEPRVGNIYEFDFGPDYQWEAVVEDCELNSVFVLRMTVSDSDWEQSLVSFRLETINDRVILRFAHKGWPDENDHFRSSSYCWAMYLRCLKRYAEKGIETEYEKRFDEQY